MKRNYEYHYVYRITNIVLRKLQEKIECPHCGKIGGVSAMKQSHFNNCKHGLGITL